MKLPARFSAYLRRMMLPCRFSMRGMVAGKVRFLAKAEYSPWSFMLLRDPEDTQMELKYAKKMGFGPGRDRFRRFGVRHPGRRFRAGESRMGPPARAGKSGEDPSEEIAQALSPTPEEAPLSEEIPPEASSKETPGAIRGLLNAPGGRLFDVPRRCDPPGGRFPVTARPEDGAS